MENNILQQLRISCRKTQEQVAEYMGVAVGTVQNWEKTLRFKSKDDLHDLLDLYDVDEIVRNAIVLGIYGKANTSKTIDQLICSTLQCAPHLQLTYVNRLRFDDIIDCLLIIEHRMSCVMCSMIYCSEYVYKNHHSYLFSRKTAAIIDQVAEEYNIILNAKYTHESLWTFNNICPDMSNSLLQLGDVLFFKEYGKDMTYEEYLDAQEKNLPPQSSRSPDTLVMNAVIEMKKEYYELYHTHRLLLSQMTMIPFACQYFKVNYEINKEGKTMWAVYHILPSGTTHIAHLLYDAEYSNAFSDIKANYANISFCEDTKPPHPPVFLTAKNEHSEHYSDFLNCNTANFVAKSYIDKLLDSLSPILQSHSPAFVDYEALIEESKNNKLLNDFISKLSRPGETK